MPETDPDKGLVSGVGVTQKGHQRRDPVKFIIDPGGRAGHKVTVEILYIPWKFAIHDGNGHQLEIIGAGLIKHGREHLRIAVEARCDGFIDPACLENGNFHLGLLAAQFLPAS